MTAHDGVRVWSAQDVASMGLKTGPVCHVQHVPGLAAHRHVEVPAAAKPSRLEMNEYLSDRWPRPNHHLGRRHVQRAGGVSGPVTRDRSRG